jgi:flagellar protein FlaG
MNSISTVLTPTASSARTGFRQPSAPSAAAQTPSSSTASGAPAQPAMNLSKAVEQIQGYLRDSGKNLSVTFDDSADRYVTRVVSSDTGEVVRTIPSEEVLEVARAINEKLGGLINQRA